MEPIARFVSWLFLPLFAPVIALIIAMYLESAQIGVFQNETLFFLPSEHKNFLLSIFTVLAVVFPCLSILYFRISGRITSLMMDNRTERILPEIVVNGSGVLLYFLLARIDPNRYLPSAIYALSMGSLLTVLACMIITFRWKISLHSAGMGIITGFVFAYFSTQAVFAFWVMPATLIASGLVMSARIYLKAHSFSEILAGYLLGTGVTAACVLLYSYFNT